MELLRKPRLFIGTYIDPIIGYCWQRTWFCSAEIDGCYASNGHTPEAAYTNWLKNHAWRYEARRPWWKFWGANESTN